MNKTAKVVAATLGIGALGAGTAQAAELQPLTPTQGVGIAGQTFSSPDLGGSTGGSGALQMDAPAGPIDVRPAPTPEQAALEEARRAGRVVRTVYIVNGKVLLDIEYDSANAPDIAALKADALQKYLSGLTPDPTPVAVSATGQVFTVG